MTATAPTITPQSPDPHASLRRKPRLGERLTELALRTVALTSIAAIVLILAFIAREALPVFAGGTVGESGTSFDLLASERLADGTEQFLWRPVSQPPTYNIVPLVVGSLKVTLVALFIAAPLGIAAAIYVSELAGKKQRELIKPTIELLAGVPSVVIGFFALIVLTTWVQQVFGTEHRLNALTAGIGLALAVCPVIFTISEDALQAVPHTYRTAALALGSDRVQMIVRVVVPAALPGILASLVLGFGRAIGETMIVLLASGNAAIVSGSVGVSTRTITATIAQELGEVVVGSDHYHVLFALGTVLFASTFVLNFAGERVIHGLRKKLGTA
ncbi:MAG TPA: phosphate ABC transporter permease subunit PstC [Polyangiaceae bacterium]|nr:phosphate ABC transporter permease subunit PstC [Polyangiaceae bacterium]